jgi:hypothetical protein
MKPPLPKGRHFRQNKSPETAGSLEMIAKELASQLEGYKPWRIGIVTKATRRGFWVNRGASEGIELGLHAEVKRLRQDSDLSVHDIFEALADPDFSRGQLAGQTNHVTRARVTKVHPDSAFLRPADPHRGRRVRAGDLVLVRGTRLWLCVGGISGTMPRAATEALRNILLQELENSDRISAIRGPSEPTGIAWSRGQAAALCTAGSNEGCNYATAGAANLSGDTLHVALGIVDVFSCETVRFITASVKAEPALTALASQSGPGGLSAGEQQRPYAEWALGVYGQYETGLLPAFSVELKKRAMAVYVLSEMRALCIASLGALEIYGIDSESHSLVSKTRYDIEHASPPHPCRDPAGRIAKTDSDGDGQKELVFWSNGLKSPVAFSVGADEEGDHLSLEPADSYWLPWSEPYADMRYVRGANFMTAGGSEGGIGFYDSRFADLDGDGHQERIYTDTDGSLRVDNTAKELSLKLLDAGASLEVHDMNMDGVPEIIVSGLTHPSESDVLAFYNYKDEGSQESWRVDELPGGVISIAAGLLDDDNAPDLAVLLRGGLRAERTTLIVMLTAKGSQIAPGSRTE